MANVPTADLNSAAEEISVGDRAEAQFEVTDADTAIALGSGDVAVLATPRVIAWTEAVTCQVVAAALPASETTVGVAVSVEHLAPTRIGETVIVDATLTEVTGKQLRFQVLVTNPDGATALSGTIVRVRVPRSRFV